jgi:precorrin-6A synthase
VKRVLVVGVGAGDPEQITVAAISALNEADVIFELERATADLTAARAALVRRFATRRPEPRRVVVAEPRRDRAATAYAAAVHDWRSGRAVSWEQALRDELGDDQVGAFLVWGDPSLYDSTIAVLDEVLARGVVAFEYSVIPGISSIQALTAAHRIALNRVGGQVLITTGRLLTERGWPARTGDIVVMLDGRGAYRAVRELPLDIYWGAYLGTPDELLVSGPLADVADELDLVRERARAEKGWIMDCYLLRSRSVE